MSSFELKKNVEYPIRYGLIITTPATGTFFALKVVTAVKPPKTSLNAMDIMKLTGGICVGALMKGYAVYKKLIKA